MGALAPRGDQGHLQLRSPGCRLDDRGGRAQLAIIDSSTVFLAFSGVSEQDIRGLSFKAELALTYFEVYFNQLWNAAMPLERGRCGSPMPASSDWRRCGWLRPGRSRPSPSREAATAAAVLRPAVEPSAVQRRVERPRLGGNP
jgi:hypothetical protein